MTQLDVRPWSASDDGDDVAVVDSACAVIETVRREAGSPERTAEARAKAAVGWRLNARWALAPLAAAAITAMWTLIWPLSSRPDLARVHSVFVLMLVGTGVLVLLQAERVRATEWTELVSALSRSFRAVDSTASGLSREVLPVLDIVRDHVRGLQERMTELSQAQQRLNLERRVADIHKRQIEAIIDNISDAVLVTDEFDRVMLLNPAAESVLGLTRADATRRPIGELAIDADIVKYIRQCREAEHAVSRRNIERSAGERDFAVTLSTIVGQSEEGKTPGVRGVVVVMRDVTRERQVAKTKSDFVSKVAHELRTPLSSIKAYVEMLVDGEATDEKTLREYYEIIHTSSDRLSRLIDNMLNISRIESGTVRVTKEPVSMAVVVKETIDVVMPQAEAKKIELQANLTPVFYQVLADKDLLAQAVLNLLSNAVKYTPDGGRVEVSMAVQEQDRTVVVAVRDTGVGIPSPDLPKLFEKFFRVEANSKMAKGTGLGLNLVKHIVETVHGGRIAVTSTVGEGSTFSMSLPLHG